MWTNSGDSSYTATQLALGAPGYWFVDQADFNLDGYPDLVAGGGENNLLLLFNDASSGFVSSYAEVSVSYIIDIDIADMDDDGDDDITYLSLSDGKVYWQENVDGVSFIEHFIGADYGEIYEHKLIDADSDGDRDVLVISQGDFSISLFDNNGGQDFSLRYATSDVNSVDYIDAGDLDGDGDIDLVTISSDLGTFFDHGALAWYENLGDQTYRTRYISTAFSRSDGLKVYDIDGDGDLDILAEADELLIWYENVSAGIFASHMLYDVGSHFYGLEVADFNSDAIEDVLVTPLSSVDVVALPLPRVDYNVVNGDLGAVTLQAADEDGNNVRFSIVGGPDASLFTLDSATGQIAFTSAHNVDTPQDQNLDNSYLVWVSVTDGYSSANQLVAFNVVSPGL